LILIRDKSIVLMFTHYRTNGFILKETDRGEADRIFTIYTKDFGKSEFLAKAERKIKSKLRGGLELFCLSEIEFVQGKIYKTLTDAISIKNFNNLKGNLVRLAIVYKISETFNDLIKEQEEDKRIWQLLKEIFQELDDRGLKSEIIYHYFFWNILSFLGYQPELYNCSVCQNKLTPGELYFNSKEGGIICQNCFKKLKSNKGIKPEIIKILRIILEKDLKKLLRLKIEKSYLESLDIISQDYYSYIF